MMIYRLKIAFQSLLLLLILSCKKPSGSDPVFKTEPELNTIVPTLQEVSGIADSKNNPGKIWAQEDSGHPPELHLISHEGNVLKSIFIKGITNRDWEDLCLAGGEIYIGDIGDNGAVHSEYYVYRFPEPSASSDTVFTADRIRFQYPDGSHDAEALLVDPVTKDILIITKNDNPSRVYRLAFPFSTTAINQALYHHSLTYTGITGSAISPSGSEIILKTYGRLYYYQRKTGESITQALQKDPVSLAYAPEPQGEAVCFAMDDSGFFTLSETAWSPDTYLRFYRRN